MLISIYTYPSHIKIYKFGIKFKTECLELTGCQSLRCNDFRALWYKLAEIIKTISSGEGIGSDEVGVVVAAAAANATFEAFEQR